MDSELSRQSAPGNNKLVIWGVATVFGLMILCGSIGVVAWNLDKSAAHFPNARLVAHHSNYSLPKLYRWDHTYATNASIDEVYQWYSITFDMGPEKEANGSCSLLEEMNSTFFYERYTGVLICEMNVERMMFVTRGTKLFP